MGVEIERKFLLQGDAWRAHVNLNKGKRVEQAYLPPDWLQLPDQGSMSVLRLMSPDTQQCGPTFSYPVPREDIDAMRAVCEGEYSVRVRIKGGNKAYLTIKSSNPGMTRAEFEYTIPVVDVQKIFNQCLYQGSIIDKVRYEVSYGDLTIEVDQFFGDNEGLVVAEVELPDENTAFNLPGWFGREVTHEPCVYNERLSKNPAKNWLHDWLNAA